MRELGVKRGDRILIMLPNQVALWEVMLAGIKLGTYGFLRFSLPLLPEASKSKGVVTVVVTLALIAIVYGAIVALIQPDLRRLLAFSSISHLGFCVLGVFALNFQGLQGSLLTMINLGFTTAGLFFLAGFLYLRRHSTNLSAFGGLARKVPLLATFLLIIGLPLVIHGIIVLFHAIKEPHRFARSEDHLKATQESNR